MELSFHGNEENRWSSSHGALPRLLGESGNAISGRSVCGFGDFFGAVSLLIVRFSSKKNLDTFKSHFFLVVECSGIVDWCSWVVEFSNHSGFWQWPLEQKKTKENHGFGEFPTFMSR